MKCVCPMGGDRECPEDCPLAVWASMPEADRKTQRKPIVEKLYGQGFTMEVIAAQLGVSQATITGDLRGLLVVNKPPRPKGGRPKGSRGNPKPPEVQAKHEKIVALSDGGLPVSNIAAEVGVTPRMVDRVLEVENVRREAMADPTIDRSELSQTALAKLDSAIRQHQRRLDLKFEQRVRDEVRKGIDEIVLPYWKEQIEQAKQLYERRRALMDKETFNTIRRALHPDSRQSISDQKLGLAFDTFMGLEKYLINEKDSPTKFEYPDGSGIPSNLAEWDKMKMRHRQSRRHAANPLKPR